MIGASSAEASELRRRFSIQSPSFRILGLVMELVEKLEAKVSRLLCGICS